MTDVRERLEQARRQATAADAKVAAISARRLAGLRKMVPRAAAQQVDDPRLTAKDREALQRELAGRLPARVRKTPQSPPMLVGSLKWAVLHPRVMFPTLGILALVLVAILNTPKTIGAGRLAYDLEVIWPDDGMVQLLPRGETFAIVGFTDNQWQIRVWRPAKHYELLLLPQDALEATR